jgi:hypothetical protein
MAAENRRFFVIRSMFRVGAARPALFPLRPWRRKPVGAQSPALHPSIMLGHEGKAEGLSISLPYAATAAWYSAK